MSKSRKDYIYNLLYQIFNLLFPIILTPYTSRVLGAKCIGIYSYIFTFVSYFTMFSILGISNLGSRLIAKNKDDLESISKTFFSLYYIQLFMSLLMTLLYFIFSFLFLKDNLNIALIQSIFIFSSIFDVWWLFNGLEKFKLNIIKNMLVKISTLILIFIFVKNENDLWIYTLIMVSSTLIINLLWWIFLKKEIKFVKVEFKDIKKNIKPSLLLFLPILFQSIYTSMDKLMLGTMTTMIEVGLYEQAAKFMKIPYAFTNALSYVMLPKNSNLVKKNKNIEDNMKKSFEFIMFLILPIIFGIIVISKNLIPIFLGEAFLKSSSILNILIFATLFVSINSIISSQYLMPNEFDKIYVGSILLGAITNTLLNFILIPKLSSIGAAYATLITEFLIMLYQIIKIRKKFKFIKYIKSSIKFLLSAVIMFIVGYLINYLHLNNLYSLLLKIIICSFVYLLLNIKYIKDNLKIGKIWKKCNSTSI